MLACCLAYRSNQEEVLERPQISEHVVAQNDLSLHTATDCAPITITPKRSPTESPRKLDIVVIPPVEASTPKRSADSPRKVTKRCQLRNCGLKNCDVMDDHPYQCGSCDLVFPTVESYVSHETKHIKGTQRPSNVTRKKRRAKKVDRKERRAKNAQKRNEERRERQAAFAKFIRPPQVFVRVRPLNDEEAKVSYVAPGLKTKTELAKDLGGDQKVTLLEEGILGGFEGLLGVESSNTEVYNAVLADKIEMILRGAQVSMFCYGHTGTGKTHTSMGHRSHPGLFKLACKDILEALEKINVGLPETQKLSIQVRFTEVHLRKVYDLLQDPKAECHIREGENGEFNIRRQAVKSAKGWFVSGDQKYVRVKDVPALLQILEKGIETRACGSSSVHDESSRSHAMMEMEIITEEVAEVREQVNELDAKLTWAQCKSESGHPHWPRRKVVQLAEKLRKLRETMRTIAEGTQDLKRSGVAIGGTLTLTDLAGADFDHRTYKESGENGKQAQLESAEINNQLFTLKECMRTDVARKPWRDTVLSKILKKVLQPASGREVQAIMVATVSPAEIRERHTLNTLRYAQMVSGFEDDKAEASKASRDRDMKRQIRAVYKEHCPGKTPDEVEEIMAKWAKKGKLNRLLALVWAKYTKTQKNTANEKSAAASA